MKPAHIVFMDYLAENGLTLTPQRALIVESFLDNKGHFSSENLFVKVRRIDPNIGQATVYRTLKLLVASGLAETFDMGDGVAVYERTYGQDHHDHLICVKCGARVEIVDPVIEERQETVASGKGFTLTRHVMLLYGICKECISRGE